MGKLVWAEDEEGNQEVAQRKPTPGRERMSQNICPLPWPHGFQWYDVNLIAPNRVSSDWKGKTTGLTAPTLQKPLES